MPESQTHRACPAAARVHLALCQLAAERRNLNVHASRQAIAGMAGLRGVSTVSRSLTALQAAGTTRQANLRLHGASGGIAEVMAVGLQVRADNPVGPLALFDDRVKRIRRLPLQADLNGLRDRNAPALWLALAGMANAATSLKLSVTDADLAARTGLGLQQVGRARRCLAAAGWIRVARRGGRRGRRVVCSTLSLVVGTATRAFAPLHALAAPNVSNTARDIPTGLVTAHGNCNNTRNEAHRARAASPRRSDSYYLRYRPARDDNDDSLRRDHWRRQQQERQAQVDQDIAGYLDTGDPATRTRHYDRLDAVGRRRLHLECQRRERDVEPLAPPTRIPEAMRPRALDADLMAMVGGEVAPADRLARLERHHAILADVEAEARRRVLMVEGLASEHHPQHRCYIRSRRLWKRYWFAMREFKAEAEDAARLVGFLMQCVEVSMLSDAEDAHERRHGLSLTLRKLRRRLRQRSLKRRNRFIYYFGWRLLAMGCALARGEEPIDPMAETYRERAMPELTEDELIADAEAFRAWQAGGPLPPSRPMPQSVPIPVYRRMGEAVGQDEIIYTPRRYHVLPRDENDPRSREVVTLSLKRLDHRCALRLRKELQIKNHWFKDDGRSWLIDVQDGYDFSRDACLVKDHFIVAATSPADVSDPTVNLMRWSPVYQTYMRAIAEWGPRLAMVVRGTNGQLFVIHDWGILDPVGPRRWSGSVGGRPCYWFETMAGFLVRLKDLLGIEEEEEKESEYDYAKVRFF